MPATTTPPALARSSSDLSSRRALILAWTPALLWIGVIAIESTSALSSNHTETLLRPVVDFFLGGWGIAHLHTINHLLRKCGHFLGYAVLSWLSFRGWLTTVSAQEHRWRNWSLRAATLAVLTAVLIAALDEFHQSFDPTRTGVFRDVALDSFGGVFAQSVVLISRLRNHRRKATAA